MDNMINWQNFESDIVNRRNQIEKAWGIDIQKARGGIYKNTSENRKLNRVGQKYGKNNEENKETTTKLFDNFRFKEKLGDYLNPIFVPLKNDELKKEKSEKDLILRDSLGNPSPKVTISVFGSKYGYPNTGGYFSTSSVSDDIINRKWSYNSLNVDNIIQEMEKSGYECKISKDGYNAPVIHCIHKKTDIYLKNKEKENSEKFKNSETVFIRFGKSPKGGYSTNYRDNIKEKGVSVFKAKIAKDGTYRVIDANHIMAVSYSVLINRDIYVLEGEEIGIGADGEPVIKVKKEITLKKYIENNFK